MSGAGGDAAIQMRLGETRVPYFEGTADVTGGQRTAYLLERRIAPAGSLPAHTFDDHMLLLPVGRTGASFRSVLNGRRLRGRIEPGGLRYLAVGDSLATSWSAPVDSILIALNPDAVHRLVDPDPDAPRAELGSRIESHADAVLAHLVLALQAHVISGATAGRIFEQSLLAAVASRLLVSYGTGRRGPAQKVMLPKWKRNRVEEFIRDRLSEPLTLERIAGEVAMSPHQLCRLFRGTTGRSVWQFVLECRVRKAMSLLGSRRAPVLTWVARECGFESYSQFIAAFRKFGGCLPSEYRRTIGR